MRRAGDAREGQAPMAGPLRERFRRQMALPGAPGVGQPTPPPGAPVPTGTPPAAGKPLKQIADMLGLFFLVACIFNILLAIWIYTDIRKRGEGSGIFIALALLAGIPAAIIYALVRIGDKKAQP